MAPDFMLGHFGLREPPILSAGCRSLFLSPWEILLPKAYRRSLLEKLPSCADQKLRLAGWPRPNANFHATPPRRCVRAFLLLPAEWPLKLPCSVSAEQGFSQAFKGEVSDFCRLRQKGAKEAEIKQKGVGRTHDGVKAIFSCFGLSWKDLREVMKRAIRALTADQANRTTDEIIQKIIAAFVHEDNEKIRGFGRF